MKGIIYVLLGACFYGVLSTFVKLAYGEGFIVNDVVGIQLLIGALILWALVGGKKLIGSNRGKKGSRQPSMNEALFLVVVGSSTGLTGVFYYQSLQYVSASFAILLLFQFTWMGVVLEAIATRKFPAKEKLVALIPLLAGTVIAGGMLSKGVTFHTEGIIYGLLSALTYTIFIFVSGRVATDADSLTRTAYMVTGGFIVAAIVVTPTFFFEPSIIFDGLGKYGLILGIMGPVLSTLFFAKGVPLTGGGMASILGAMELPMAIIMSMLVLHEQVSLLQWGGVVLIMFGVAWPELVKRSRARKKSTNI
ncbi:DMT family transporter [Paenibacillus sp. SC116]|uniref:EamA family transporter n=1 Tax=Paenibacillus sp. SC116 TaxID=2968986 RepID=UPI00215A9F86|nr:DMT family transporter [Paenibacillus sp. SC116]MCR8843283.1 DMT family transporter [Paenibacillus sp. SC116]